MSRRDVHQSRETILKRLHRGQTLTKIASEHNCHRDVIKKIVTKHCSKSGDNYNDYVRTRGRVAKKKT